MERMTLKLFLVIVVMLSLTGSYAWAEDFAPVSDGSVETMSSGDPSGGWNNVSMADPSAMSVTAEQGSAEKQSGTLKFLEPTQYRDVLVTGEKIPIATAHLAFYTVNGGSAITSVTQDEAALAGSMEYSPVLHVTKDQDVVTFSGKSYDLTYNRALGFPTVDISVNDNKDAVMTLTYGPFSPAIKEVEGQKTNAPEGTQKSIITITNGANGYSIDRKTEYYGKDNILQSSDIVSEGSGKRPTESQEIYLINPERFYRE